ncbi:MAG: cation transporter [Lachnospiraceae bacterium]|nr:cation transporter [Lachnospiraceae bacterium]
MLTILSRIFIKEKEGTAMREAWGTLCGIVGILCNLFLFAGKYAAGMVSGSVAVTADAFNNLSDAGSSFIALIGFRFAGKRPDRDHPFGHGRFEYIAGFVVSLAILMMGLELGKASVGKLFHPGPVDVGRLTLVILLVSIGVKLYMAYYNAVIGKRIGSVAMRAVALDSLSDVAATTVVLAAMGIMQYTGVNVDGFCGILVSLFILYTGCCAAKETSDPLLGTAPDPGFVRQVEEIVLSHDMVHGVHDLIVHDYGPGRRLVSLHAEVPGDKTVYEAHRMIDHIEREIYRELACDVVIHMDPLEPENEQTSELRVLVNELITSIHTQMTLHDFQVIEETDGYTSLIFDVVVPYACRLNPEEIRQRIEQGIAKLDGAYRAVVHMDQGYM